MVLAPNTRWRSLAGLAFPLTITAVSQLDAVQSSDARLLGIDLATIGDLLWPAFAVSLIVAAGMALRALDPDARWARAAARTARAAALGTILLALVRETDTLAGRAGTVALGALFALAVAGLGVALAAVRGRLATAITNGVLGSRPSRRVIAGLFGPRGDTDRPSPRWPHAAALATVTLLAAVLTVGELGALLAGMHAPDQPPASLSRLTGTWTFDPGSKPEAIQTAVDTWREHQQAIGDDFTSPRTVIGWHAVVTSAGLVPAYLALIGVAILVLVARATGVDDRGLLPATDPRVQVIHRMAASGLLVLLGIGVVNVVERLLAWHLVSVAWDGAGVTTKAAIILWALSLVRAVGIVLLAVFLVAMFALRLRRQVGPGFASWSAPGRIDVGSLVAMRAPVLILVLVTAGFFVPVQIPDVARRWTASNTVAAVLLGSLLAMVIEHHASSMLRLRKAHTDEREAGGRPRPATISLLGRIVPLRLAVVGGMAAVAFVQLFLDLVVGVPVGRGLILPVVIVAALWLLGLPLATDPAFERGKVRSPSPMIAAVAPRMLGAVVFVVVGAAVFRASVGHLAYSGRVDGFIFLAAVPPAIGTWRLLRPAPERVGSIEVAGAVVLLAVGAFMSLRANPELTPSALTVTGVFLLYGSIPFYFSYTKASLPARLVRWFRERLSRARPIRLLLGLAPLGLAAAAIAAPFAVGPAIGAFGALLLLCVLALTGVAWAIRVAETTRPPKVLAAMRFRRTPVLLLGAVWLFLTPIITTPGAHDIRIVDTGSAEEVRGIGIEDVWSRYLSANVAAPEASPDPDRRRAVPLILVSSSGGGARAAIWTSYVLDCLFAPDPVVEDPEVCIDPGETWRSTTPIAATAGVSGGGLGLSAFFVHGLEPPAGGDWVEARLGDDYLSATFSWLALVDIPRTLIGFSTDVPDRSEILERSWEASWPGAVGLDLGVYEIWREYPEVPPIVLNAASVLDACRFNASVLDIAIEAPGARCSSLAPFDANQTGLPGAGTLAATHDLADYLCPGEDIRLSTAVLTGARFPIITPMGRVASTGSCTASSPAYVVDAGYFEGSGAATILDLYEALAPLIDEHNAGGDTCVVPFLIHIDNGYESPYRGPGRPPRELTAPFVALGAARGSWMSTARIEAALAFDLPFRIGADEVAVTASGADGAPHVIRSRYARLTTRSHPGVNAPLGWSLSRASIEDLRLQLRTAENRQELAEVFAWISGSLECRASG